MALPQGITKEFLDMTYPDQYYKSVIEPAKLGKGPVPGKIEMLSKAQPFKAMRIGIDPYLPKSMQTGYDAFRAAPTKYASTALNWLGKGITTLASLPAQAAFMTLHSTPANADEVEWEKELMKKYQLQNKKKQQLQDFKNIEAKTAAEAAAKAKADAAAKANAAAASQRREGKGGTHMSRSRDQGGLGISQSQAQSISDANRAAGMSGWGLADGGLAQHAPRYANGGLIDFFRYGGFIG